ERQQRARHAAHPVGAKDAEAGLTLFCEHQHHAEMRASTFQQGGEMRIITALASASPLVLAGAPAAFDARRGCRDGTNVRRWPEGNADLSRFWTLRANWSNLALSQSPGSIVRPSLTRLPSMPVFGRTDGGP